MDCPNCKKLRRQIALLKESEAFMNPRFNETEFDEMLEVKTQLSNAFAENTRLQAKVKEQAAELDRLQADLADAHANHQQGVRWDK